MGKKNKKDKIRNPSPSNGDQSDTSEVKSSGLAATSSGQPAHAASGEADGMILDRGVEGGLEGVENLSSSRQSRLHAL